MPQYNVNIHHHHIIMSIPQLRVVTYLCPTIPVELFQGIVEVLEKETGFQTVLQYEWRSNGYSKDRIDLFESNLVDIAFMPPAGYINLEEKKNTFMELLPLTPLFKHPKNTKQLIGTYIDVIVHEDKIKHGVNQIIDLRGCRWGCVNENSLANGVMLNALKTHGENITFFGSTHRTSSHLSAVNMVLTKQVDVATIDSSALICNKRFLHNGAKDLVVLTSFGPFAPYAVVINTRLNGELKNKITKVLESINGQNENFAKFGLIKFVPNSLNLYEKEKQFMKKQKMGSSKVPYY